MQFNFSKEFLVYCALSSYFCIPAQSNSLKKVFSSDYSSATTTDKGIFINPLSV